MCKDADSDGIVSEQELIALRELFRSFEGSGDPLSASCREAESAFNSLVEKIYLEKVKPAFDTVTLSQFRSYARIICRKRISKEGPPFPCT
jgi:hypothetical protein